MVESPVFPSEADAFRAGFQQWRGRGRTPRVRTNAKRETALDLSEFRQCGLHDHLISSYDGTLTLEQFMPPGQLVREAFNQWLADNLGYDVYCGRVPSIDSCAGNVVSGIDRESGAAS